MTASVGERSGIGRFQIRSGECLENPNRWSCGVTSEKKREDGDWMQNTGKFRVHAGSWSAASAFNPGRYRRG